MHRDSQSQGLRYRRKSGGDSKEDPPVSMPNTEVKLLNVDDTWRATARESRKLPDFEHKRKHPYQMIGILFYDKKANNGPLVKRLRHGPFTAVTRVRFPHGSPKL